MDWNEKVDEIYEKIKAADGKPDPQDIKSSIDVMDQLRPLSPHRTKLRVILNVDGKIAGRVSKYDTEAGESWFPHPGTDPNIQGWKQNDTNGYYLPNTFFDMSEFNDVLRLDDWSGGGYGKRSNKLTFYSYRFDSKIEVQLKHFLEVSVDMLMNHLVGRWAFTSTGASLCMRGVDVD